MTSTETTTSTTTKTVTWNGFEVEVGSAAWQLLVDEGRLPKPPVPLEPGWSFLGVPLKVGWK